MSDEEKEGEKEQEEHTHDMCRHCELTEHIEYREHNIGMINNIINYLGHEKHMAEEDPDYDDVESLDAVLEMFQFKREMERDILKDLQEELQTFVSEHQNTQKEVDLESN